MLDLLKKFSKTKLTPAQSAEQEINNCITPLRLPTTRSEGNTQLALTHKTKVARLGSSFFCLASIKTKKGVYHCIITVPPGYTVGYAGLRSIITTFHSVPTERDALRKIAKIFVLDPTGVNAIKEMLPDFIVGELTYELAMTSESLLLPRFLTTIREVITDPRHFKLNSRNVPREENPEHPEDCPFKIKPPHVNMEYRNPRWKLLTDTDEFTDYTRRAILLRESTYISGYIVHSSTQGKVSVWFGLNHQMDSIQFNQFLLELNYTGRGLRKYTDDGEFITPSDVFVYSDNAIVRKEMADKFGFTEGVHFYSSNIDEIRGDGSTKFLVITKKPSLGISSSSMIHVYTNPRGKSNDGRYGSTSE